MQSIRVAAGIVNAEWTAHPAGSRRPTRRARLILPTHSDRPQPHACPYRRKRSGMTVRGVVYVESAAATMAGFPRFDDVIIRPAVSRLAAEVEDQHSRFHCAILHFEPAAS